MLRSNLVIKPSLVQQPIANVVHMVSREASHLHQDTSMHRCEHNENLDHLDHVSQHLPPAGEPRARPVAEEGRPAPVVVVAPSMGKLSVSPAETDK